MFFWPTRVLAPHFYRSAGRKLLADFRDAGGKLNASMVRVDGAPPFQSVTELTIRRNRREVSVLTGLASAPNYRNEITFT